MEAGRELDGLVAKMIMGYAVLDGACSGTIVEEMGPGIKQQRLVSPYSTEMAAAWLVVEQVEQAGYRCALLHYERGTWGCCFYPREGRPVGYAPNSEPDAATTAPLAICLAAIEAIQVKEPVCPTRPL